MIATCYIVRRQVATGNVYTIDKGKLKGSRWGKEFSNVSNQSR